MQMIFNIKDVVVNTISLVTKNNRPAVKKAETSFAIFKTAKESETLSDDQINRLDNIQKVFESVSKDIEKIKN